MERVSDRKFIKCSVCHKTISARSRSGKCRSCAANALEKISYLPTPSAIRAECQFIISNLPEAERQRRIADDNLRPKPAMTLGVHFCHSAVPEPYED